MALNLQERANMVFQKEKEGIRHSPIINNNRRAPITSQGITNIEVNLFIY